MRWMLASWVILATFLLVFSVGAQGVTTPAITSPITGQTLQGQVAITGTTGLPNFASAELDFTYSSDETNTRFPVQLMTQPIENSLLSFWDTTTISDGNYILLLRVYLTDGTFRDVSIKVQIRNYSVLPSPIPTVTTTLPAIQIPTPMLIVPSKTPTSAPLPTPTFLPMNPAVPNVNDVYSGFWRGALIVLLIFFAYGIAIRLRRS